MDCEHALEAISAALDGEISPAEQAELSEHLLLCADCRRLAEDLSALSAVLDASEQAPPPALSRRVMEAVAAQRQPVSVSAGKCLRPWLRTAVAMLALCICLGGAGLWLFRSGQDPAALSGNGSLPAGSEWAPASCYIAPSSQPEYSDDHDGTPSADGVDRAFAPPADSGLLTSAETQPIAGDSEPGSASESAPKAGLTSSAEQPQAAAYGTTPDSLSPEEPDFCSFQNQQVFRVAWSAGADAPSARIVGTVQSLEDFAAQFPEDDLSALLDVCDDSWFSTSRLLAVVVEEGSGSITHSIAAQGLHRDRVEIVRTVPEVGTDDMALWVLTAQVDAAFHDGDLLDVVFTDLP